MSKTPAARGRTGLAAATAQVLAMLALLLSALAPSQARAAEGPLSMAEISPGVRVEGRLISAVDGFGGLDTIPAGLRVLLPEGWKTYWRSPGSAALPPVFDWSRSVNVERVDVRWPAPERIDSLGIETFGYGGELVLPLDVTPSHPRLPVTLAGRVELLVCSTICVPAELDVSLRMTSVAATPDGPNANLLERFAARVPVAPGAGGIAVERVALAVDGATPVLRVELTSAIPFAAPDVLVEAGPEWEFEAPSVRLEAGRSRAVAELPARFGPADPAAMIGSSVTLTVIDGVRAVESGATVVAAVPAALAGASIWAVLALAVLGGLILNLMPCVLPVLSLKLLAAVSHGGAEPARVRAGFLASAAGILASFLVLAAGVIAVRAAGGAVGWGIQFQQPLFLVFMIVVLTLFACNLFGLFEIRLPAAVADRAGRVGGHGTGGQGLGGHFATGAFATLLATPCSAPFLGTAVGFALARGPAEVVAVFLALGLGLALPYLLVAAMPRLATALPRPGRWMIRLRRVLGVALAGTALWLLAVLGVVESATAAWLVGGLMAAIGLVLAARSLSRGGVRRVAAGLAALLAAVAFAVPYGLGTAEGAGGRAPATDWAVFDRPEISRLVGEGRIVFVDVTADWCITCQANKLLVLDRDPVARILASDAVVPMRADWTRPDDRIAAYLAAFGRYGIPLNVVYGPGAPDGIALPELLGAEAVLEALSRARGADAETLDSGGD